MAPGSKWVQSLPTSSIFCKMCAFRIKSRPMNLSGKAVEPMVSETIQAAPGADSVFSHVEAASTESPMVLSECREAFHPGATELIDAPAGDSGCRPIPMVRCCGYTRW